MCKLKKALAKADFEALSTLVFTANEVEAIITDAENELEDDENLIAGTEPRNAMLKNRIERAEKRIVENQAIIDNGQMLLEMIEKNEELFGSSFYDE